MVIAGVKELLRLSVMDFLLVAHTHLYTRVVQIHLDAFLYKLADKMFL